MIKHFSRTEVREEELRDHKKLIFGSRIVRALFKLSQYFILIRKSTKSGRLRERIFWEIVN
jgi:hypothetical protein